MIPLSSGCSRRKAVICASGSSFAITRYDRFGRLKLATRPSLTGSLPTTNTKGIVALAALAVNAAVSLPREIRHNDNVVWVTDEQTDDIIWRRVAPFVSRNLATFGDKKPLGLNARFRFYRYGHNDFFKFHSDGSWPGSRVISAQKANTANAFSLFR